MSMAAVPYVVAYAGIAGFVIAVVARLVMWARMPMHLRWELYPVAHEGKGRAQYGGSYLEDSDWWKRKREVSLWGEVKFLVPEIAFLVALKEHNPKLWLRSFPFHFGLYLVGTCTVIMMGGGVLAALAPGEISGPLQAALCKVVPVLGGLGLGLGILGAIGLLQRRMSTPELRLYSAPADYLNLVLFLVVFGFAFLTFSWVDRDFSAVSLFVRNLVTFKLGELPGSGPVAVLPAVSAVLLAGLTAYIPLTHMSHFVGKYFAYHSIRWNDEPNLAGGKQEKTIQRLLSQPVTWAAPHIAGDGRRTWVDIATEEVER